MILYLNSKWPLGVMRGTPCVLIAKHRPHIFLTLIKKQTSIIVSQEIWDFIDENRNSRN